MFLGKFQSLNLFFSDIGKLSFCEELENLFRHQSDGSYDVAGMQPKMFVFIIDITIRKRGHLDKQ